MAVVTREQVLSATKRRMEEVPVPEWGDEDSTVFIRELSGKERDRFDMDSIVMVGNGRNRKIEASDKPVRSRLVAICACDSEGNSLFTLADVEALGETSAAALDRCFDVAQRLSGFTAADVQALEKN